MAVLRLIDKKCQVPDCTSGMMYDVEFNSGDLFGRFCRKDAEAKLKEAEQVERERPQEAVIKAAR
jgi:hypothetical protein